ncbi:hypothetical protein TNCV_3125551 [Trichonephila clavipes]|nr:hypothetical protein TNCV_3125551 [Trichonephila clavipes]
MALMKNFEMGIVEMLNGTNWKTLNKKLSWVLEVPRKSAVAHSRLLIGHDCLRSHLYRIGITDSLNCILCDYGQPFTTEHLDACPTLISLDSIVEKYLRARVLMT